MAKGGAFFFMVFAALTAAPTFSQINPIWLYGPYTPVSISAASQPDFYLGVLEGSLRIMPDWEINGFGHTLSLQRADTVPAAARHHLGRCGRVAVLGTVGHRRPEVPPRQRPGEERADPDRDRHGRVVFYGVLWAEGANDVIADQFQIPLYTITWIARVAIFLGPLIAFVATKRICLGLQRKDKELLEHGLETGIIRQLPTGSSSRSTERYPRSPGLCSRPSSRRSCCPRRAR